MLTVRIPDDLAQRLNALCAETERSKSYYVKKALQQYLEDREDILLATAAWEEHQLNNGKTYTFEEVEAILGLTDGK